MVQRGRRAWRVLWRALWGLEVGGKGLARLSLFLRFLNSLDSGKDAEELKDKGH